jgi:hypothetical protein
MHKEHTLLRARSHTIERNCEPVITWIEWPLPNEDPMVANYTFVPVVT